MERVDLHIHTTASDGSDTPEQVVRQAKKIGLRAIAITDHDTVSGVAPAQAEGQKLGVEVLMGVEFSAQYGGREVHLLGYDFLPDAAPMQEICVWCVRERETRNAEMARRLTDLGYPIDYAAIRAATTVPGRPHLARALMALGAAKSISDAFSRYLSRGCPAYVPRKRLALRELAEAIAQSGGVPVLAHPMHYKLEPNEVEKLVQEAKACGVAGLETFYAANTVEQTERTRQLAQKYELLQTGGSDYHGTFKPEVRLGTPDVPYRAVELLRHFRA